MPRILTLAFVLFLAAPAVAQAGTYHVYTCAAAGKVWANGAWKTTAASGVTVDASCAGNFIALTVPAGARMANNTSAALSFTSPAGTTIADFVLSRQIGYNNPVAEGTHRYFLLYTLGPTHFAGAGNFQDATRNALNAQRQWYGYPDGNVAVARSTVSRASFPALAGYHRRQRAPPARRLLQPRDAVLGGGRRRDQPHPARLRRDDQRPDAAGGDRRRLRPARGRRAQRLGPGDGDGHRRRRHPQGRAGRRHRTRWRPRSSARGLRGGPHRREPHLRLQPARAVPRASAARPCRPPRCPPASAR